MDSEKKFKEPWYMRFPDFSKLKDEEVLEEFGKLTWNECSQTKDKQISNIRQFPPNKEFYFPFWVMDRLKEAMREYVRGEWWSSIALCGMIAEFTVNSMLESYLSKIKECLPGIKKMKDLLGSRLSEKIKILKCCNIINEGDYERLEDMRDTRNEYVHFKELSEKEREKLKSDNFKMLKHLFDLLDKENISTKYLEYLNYLIKKYGR